ncbi:electron transport protein SCO1/SenC [Mucilaginibacter sp. PPCGB 2223]|uniref:SCO family protein n=1 Tax=Mucilaginibacter sp. PPCGB 2223 TaxID=1886027 RepID=UPI00082681A4|nr:SCO family protein [Mucilaginibacter sp. PPCGB 2223]OCX51053.1 electron transport protein SCO1/SenC [Mucilaginibacter sp. PPCGB 2223]
MASPILKGIKNIVILALILAVPGFLYYLLTAKGKNRYKPLPIYGPKIVAKTTHKGFHGKRIPDTIYHEVSDFNLTDQDGRPVTLKTFEKKIVIFSFFFSNCPTVCAQVNSNLDSLAKGYQKNKLIQFVSVTVDPDRDTPGALKKYAAQYGLSSNKWSFLTGDTTNIYRLARQGLLVNALKSGPGKDDFIYSDKVIMVDASRRIRGYYSGTSVTDMQRLDDEIRVQITEELRKVETPEM